jgi:tyrosyl-tRNA synthetase
MSDSKLYEIYQRAHAAVLQESSFLKGRVLTLVDAAFSDPQQRKAFKDLVAQEIEKAFHGGDRDILVYAFKEVGKLYGEEIFPDFGKPVSL